MASYSSYKKVNADNFTDISQLTDDKFALDTGKNYGVVWVRGFLGAASPGCCCQWTVPTGVRRATFELWGAGGNGNGACSCNRCHKYKGAGGGYYNSKTISVSPGASYTVCAGGVFPCCSFECTACNGCSSYAIGTGLSNFCAIGGDTGRAETNWPVACYSDFSCCVGPNTFDGDFGMGNHNGAWGGNWLCHCFHKQFKSTGAPFLSAGGNSVRGELYGCWIRCGCWSVPYATGGQSAMTNNCGACCGQGGTGGSGVVKITFS
jgi:hypothetical protein